MAKDEKKKEEEKEEKTAGEEEASAEGSSEGGKKKLSKKMIIIIAVLAVLITGGGVGGGLYFAGVFGHKGDEAGQEKSETAAGKKEGRAVFFSLGDIIVNLSGEGKRPNYLKINVSLELADEKDLPLMESIKPRIIDNFQAYLRELRVEDLRGSAGLYRLREELLLRVTETAQPVRVKDVLFQEMLVQ